MAKREALNYLRHRNRTVSYDDKVNSITVKVDTNSLWLQDILKLLSDEEELIFIEHCIWGKSLKVICKEKGFSYRTIVRIYAGIQNSYYW